MTVIIAKANQDLFKSFHSRIKFHEQSEHTVCFNTTEKKFIEIRNKVRERGLNPYAVMSW
jgi:hypothetical protein